MTLAWLLAGVLAVWRLTHLLHAEDGPWAMSARLRNAAGEGSFGDLLDCFYCLSLWISAAVALLIGDSPAQWLLLWLGLSGGAILLDRVTAPMPAYVEDAVDEENEDDGMLRAEKTNVDAAGEGPGKP